jgi:protease I
LRAPLPDLSHNLKKEVLMAGELNGRTVAVLATDGFEQVELTEPVRALKEAGAKVHVVSPKPGEIQGWKHHDKGDKVKVDIALSSAEPASYDALVLPGGVINPDALRLEEKAIAFVRHFVEAKKPIAAICHGPWTLINAGAVKGKKMTSWPSLQVDLRNAGATWVDEPVVVDDGLVTSRKPDDLPKFNAKMIEEIREGRHDRAHRSAA